MSMRTWFWRFGAVLALSACGGGGGGDGDSSPNPRLSAKTTQVSATAAMGMPAPSATFQLSVDNMPEQGLFAAFSISGRGVSDAFIGTSNRSTADIQVVLEAPAMIGPGTHEAVITAMVCLEDPCRNQIAGSPVSVAVRYAVESMSRVSALPVTLEATATTSQPAPEVNMPALRIEGPVPAANLHYQVQVAGASGVEMARVVQGADASQGSLSVMMRSPALMAQAVHEGSLAVRACYDPACSFEVPGSPVQIPVRYTVTDGGSGPPPTSVGPLQVTSRAALPHDVIDAEWSRALGAVVMVSTWPSSALIVHDPVSRTSRSVALVKPPVAVSLSPDGLQAAVGHDALVTVVDLSTIGQPGAAPPRHLNLSSNVSDLVFDGTGHVHVFPATDQWVDVHSLKVADNTEVQTWALLYAGSRARLHPGGTRLYTANRGLSPDDIASYAITGDAVTLLGDSPYHGDYAMCGNLWFNEAGSTIYTACGATFRASADRSRDMFYAGMLPLHTAAQSGRIDWISQYEAGKEIALLETDSFGCSFITQGTACRSYLRLLESDFYGHKSTAWLGPVTVAGSSYTQRGMFVFHAATGQRVLISRLLAMPNPSAEFYVSLVP